MSESSPNLRPKSPSRSKTGKSEGSNSINSLHLAAVLQEHRLVSAGGALGHLAAPLLLVLAIVQLHADLPEPGREHALASPHHTPSDGAPLECGPGAPGEADLLAGEPGLLTLEVIHLGGVIQTLSDAATALQRQQSHLEAILHYPGLTSDAGTSHEVNGL